MKIAVNTTIDHEIKQLAISNGINFTEAVDFGVKFLLAEQLIIEYPSCRLVSKLERMRELLEETSQELERLKNPEEDEPIEEGNPADEFDRIMKENMEAQNEN